MRGELHAMIIDRDARKSREGANHSSSAQSRWCDEFIKYRWELYIVSNKWLNETKGNRHSCNYLRILRVHKIEKTGVQPGNGSSLRRGSPHPHAFVSALPMLLLRFNKSHSEVT
jgi:hypothetical protein